MKNKFKLIIGFFLIVFLLSSCLQTSQNVGLMGRNIQTTTDYDGIWKLKMYVGSKYYHADFSVENGQFYKKYSPNGNAIKGYISGDGRFSMYQTFNHGGWNTGAFSFTLDRERSTTTRLVGKWSGLDGAHLKRDGQEYGAGRWEVIVSRQQSMKIDRDKSDLNGKWKISGIEKSGKYVEAKFKDELFFIFNGKSFDIVANGESLTDAFSLAEAAQTLSLAEAAQTLVSDHNLDQSRAADIATALGNLANSSPTTSNAEVDEFDLGKISYNVKNGKITLSNPSGEKLTANIEFFNPISLRVSNFEATQNATIIALSVKAALTGKGIFTIPKSLAKNNVIYFSKIQK